MKKFFAIFAFTAVMVFTAFTPSASADVNIRIDQALFNKSAGEIILQTVVENTIDQPVHLREFLVKRLTIFDADKNPIWEGSVEFKGLDVPIGANGSVDMTFTISGTTPPDYEGEMFTQDDSLVVWERD